MIFFFSNIRFFFQNSRNFGKYELNVILIYNLSLECPQTTISDQPRKQYRKRRGPTLVKYTSKVSYYLDCSPSNSNTLPNSMGPSWLH